MKKTEGVMGIKDLVKPLTKEEAYFHYKMKQIEEEKLKLKQTVLKTDKGATQQTKEKK
jgi:aromatic ring-cleaving dioxygenase|tara:strand:- start:30 stop:203 length:174 start_codon:yes stop_codon:yes gene_type:complete